MKLLKNFLSNQSGATAVEYGMIVAGIAVAISAVVVTIGENLNIKFTALNTALVP